MCRPALAPAILLSSFVSRLFGFCRTRYFVVEPRKYYAANQTIEKRICQPDYAADGTDRVTTIQPADECRFPCSPCGQNTHADQNGAGVVAGVHWRVTLRRADCQGGGRGRELTGTGH